MATYRYRDDDMTVELPAAWMPITWPDWDDCGVIPNGVPEQVWREHHGHDATMMWTGMGAMGLYCRTCSIRLNWAAELGIEQICSRRADITTFAEGPRRTYVCGCGDPRCPEADKVIRE